ncbi:hypothetical protein Ga0466249_004558 [Sporomusaceae bacterium BoRhaA]|uniref:lactate racemase domain-containing protein n=1 Tax=Pelorhabdus rhamnosifermentans TaxID=2772457 RepID=UPI001C05F98F|nr:lactate racemase domain-containing protein [Pelorhabdus rhamnosifermentans]MBU2703413.1 hypothetical protein [Pelorhabdus rhamnosifermentans]
MDTDVIEQLCSDVEIPKMVRVKQHFDPSHIPPENIPEVINKELARDSISSQFKSGKSIAITCGSRGVANIAIILKAIVDYAKSKGAKPFIFPAMGSHGGATPKGQLEIVNGYGVTEESMGCPVRATMETKQIGMTDDGRPVFIDKYAAEADGIILCGRIKAHTQFVGPYESGLMKMAVIGMGKQHGAEGVHEQGFTHMAENLQRYGKVILHSAPIVCGVGVMENAYDQTYKIVALTAPEIEQREPQLLVEAKEKMGRIMIPNADILIVDEIGKNISGDGMDPNVSGTLPRETGVPRGKDGSEPRIGNFKAQRCVVLDLTEETHGNANGIGLADVTTQRAVNKIVNEMAYPNALTSTILEMVKVPFYTRNDKVAIQVGIKSCSGIDKLRPRIIRIKNTMEIEEIEVSEALLHEVEKNQNMEVVGKLKSVKFNENGNLF